MCCAEVGRDKSGTLKTKNLRPKSGGFCFYERENEMNYNDYPALYIAADKASLNAQNKLLFNYRLKILFLLLGVVLAAQTIMLEFFSIISALVFLLLLFIYVFSYVQKHQDKWYRTRALAESIKTATWRFMMSSEPFNKESKESNLDSFRQLLFELLKENKILGDCLGGGVAAKDQVTDFMLQMHKNDYQEKHNFYLKHRIDEQRVWYGKKFSDNKEASKFWFVTICFLYGTSIFFLLLRIKFPTLTYLPVEILSLVASGLIGWTQLRRFDELASAYGLTAHEIGVIKARFSEVRNQNELGIFVSDAENAFSREHIQWAARRDFN